MAVVIVLFYACWFVVPQRRACIHAYIIHSRASRMGRSSHDLTWQGYLDSQPVGLPVLGLDQG